MEKIELILPKAHENVKITPDIEREMNDVQRELDRHSDRLPDGKIHFIISKGFYKHEKKVLSVASVIVNKTNKDINSLEMNLLFALRNKPQAKFAPMHAFLDKEFLGLIKNNQAFILHMDVPAKNVDTKDNVFRPNEMTGKIENMEYHYIK